MTGIEVVSFGCRLNRYESEVVRLRAVEAGLCDAVIVNTCAVTAEAVRQSRQAIRRARRRRPSSRIIATGCAAQTEPHTYAAMAEVDLVIGNAEKLDAASYAGSASSGARIRTKGLQTTELLAPPPVGRLEGRARGFLEVQNGCDHRCTFCVIPFGRGRSRSLPPDLAIGHMRRLADAGISEVILTGVDVTAYGAELPERPSLGTLIARALKEVPAIRRLRLSSLDPVEVDEDLFRMIVGEERLMPHIHLSLQAGHDIILKRMKRRHLRKDAVALCDRIRRRRPEVVFGADMIAGFPTETDTMFESSLSLVDECGITYLHVFPFSARPGTPAARMPQLDAAGVRERARLLRLKGDQRLGAFLRNEVGLYPPGSGREQRSRPYPAFRAGGI